jgi:hypothetical protein
VVVLGEGRGAMDGTVVDVSSRGMGLTVPESLPLGTPIKIEAHDELILGEVCYCVAHEGAYRVGLAVKHRLAGLAQLHSLNRALMAAAFPRVAPMDAIGVDSTIMGG